MTDRQPPSQGPRTGQVIRGMYRLGPMIGKGGMGEIYAADHVSIPRRFAIKILRGDYTQDPEAMRRFHREATIAASVGSIHIVEVFDFNQAEDGCLYMAMELLEGESLTDYIKRVCRVEPCRWLTLLTQIADGLEATHREGVVHRDLKPDNLFLARDRRGNEVLKILDFGISKIKTSESMQTQAGAIMGTPNYMSPEQAAGDTKSIDLRTDIFSLGAITYEALSGSMAFGGPSLPAIFLKICFEDPKPLSELAPRVPPRAIAAVSKALSKNPTERFDSVKSFVEEFRLGLENSEMAAAAVAEPSLDESMSIRATAYTLQLINSQTTLSGSASEATLIGTQLPKHKRTVLFFVLCIGALLSIGGLAVFISRISINSGKAARGLTGFDAGQPDAAVRSLSTAPSISPISPTTAVDASAARPIPIMAITIDPLMRTSLPRKRQLRTDMQVPRPQPSVMELPARRRATEQWPTPDFSLPIRTRRPRRDIAD